MSKNNAKMVQQKMSDQRQKFGIRKLSVGVASVLLGTVFYMQGGAVHADVNPTVSVDDNSVNVVNENSGTSSLAVGSGTSSSAGSANSAIPVVSVSDVTNSIATSQTSESPVDSSAGQVSNAASAVSEQGSVTPASQVNVGVDKIVKNENSNVDSDSTQVPNSQIASEKSVVRSGIVNSSGVTPSQPVLATPAETEVPVANLAVDSKVNIAYTANDQAIKINYVDIDTNDPVDLTKWTYDVDNLGNAHVLSYNGDITQPIYIPNSYDFIQAGKITAGHKVFITSDNMHKLAGSGIHELYISKNGNGKVIAEDSDWHGTFCGSKYIIGRNGQLSEIIDKNLEKLDLTNLDVTNIKNMKSMFYRASNLTSISGLSNWNTHKVTDMSDMFSGASKLTNIDDLSNWDTSNVTDMSYMFKWDRQLTNIGNLSSWNTSNVTDMSSMFSEASSLTNIGNLSNWDTSKVTDMNYMFSDTSKLTNIGDLSNWDTHNVTNMNSMFSEASSLTNIGNLSNWDTSNVTDMSYMFNDTSKLTNIGDLSNWDTSKVTDMSNMFYKASNLTNIGNLSNWDTSKVTKMALMFGATLKLINIGDLSNWDTRNVTSMSSMFSDTSSLTNIGDLSNWDTHNVTNMSFMFQGASSLTNIGDLSNWDTSKVAYMNSMFSEASSLTNIGDLSNWDTSKVTYMMYMFYKASNLTNIGNLSNWDTSKVTYMNDMFSEASSLTNIGDLSNWDTHNVTNMSAMFYRTFNLTNVGDLSKWNVNNVVNSQKMMQSFGKDSKEPILQKLPSFTKTKNSSSELPIASTGTGVYDARGITSDVQRTSADNYWNNHIVLTSDTSLLDHSNISNNVNSKINQITINGNKIALPVFYKDYQDLHDTVQKTIDDYAEKLRSQGKIVKNTPKVADYSTEPTTDWLKYFTNYTIDVVNQTKINYVDIDGTTIHTTVIEGKSGETVSVPNEIPTGYKLVSGLSVPTEITFTADGYPITNLTIEAIHTTVTAYNPKTTADKLPDNPTKNYPEGVSESDLNKTIIRTINITDPRTQKVTPVVQTVYLTRSADVDEITGEVVYSDWTTSSFDSYNVPEVPGYTASQTSVAKETVTSDTKDKTVNITYTANDHQISVKYVDDDQGEKVVGTGAVNGKTGADVTITPSLPKGYMLTPGKDTPSTYTVTAGDNQVVTIHVQKQFVDTSAIDPQAKQTRTVTLHYVYGAGDKQGQKAFDDAVLNVYYHRTASLDRATNKTTYGDWLWDQSQGDPSTPGYHVVSGKWTNLPQHWANVTADAPSIKGYHADLGQNDPANTNHVPANVWVYPTWNGAGSAGDTLDGHESKAYQTSAHLYEVQPEHTVKYMPNKTTLTINYVDDDNKGAVVGHQSWNGTIGQHVDLTLTPPDNYVLSPGWSNPTSYDFDGVNNAWYNVHVKHAVQTQTVTSQLTIHYVNSEDHQQELKAPTVITRQYTRTNVSHNDGTTQYGDWSYVPGSFKQTGTQITVNDSDNPVKQDNVDKNGENMDGFTVIAMYPTIEDYTTHDGIGGVRLTDWLGNSDRQAASLTDNFYAEYDEHKERSIAVRFFDDQLYGQQVGQATTVTGRDGDTVNLKLTVPDKYQLADGQQLPTSYTFTKGSGDLEIHLTHKVVQRKATVNVKLSSDALVRITDDRDGVTDVVPQTHWAQLDDKIKKSPDLMHYVMSSVDVGTLTGHVNYDLVDEGIVSFGNDWTTLNLGGQTYQMPDGDDVVDGVVFDFSDGTSEKFVEEYLKRYPNADLDYVNRSWHSYLSANATKNLLSHESGPMLGSVLQAGLAGNKPNTLAKATSDRAATSVEMGDTTIDLSLLQSFDFETRDFSEQNGQLRADGFVPVVGVYIPYVEKTATRMINVTTPDGKTTTVKQTVTLAKQVDFGKDAHPAWTTGEWASYDVPTIPGYTASQSQVAKETVTGETTDQTVNITYTANDQSTHVNYVDAQGKTIHTTTVNGKTGQTVKVSSEVPAGWKLVDGQTVPSEITFGPDGYADTSVKIEHRHVTVTPDALKTTTDHLPDNPGKTYPAGVGHNDLNKTVTGTIKVTMPDGQVKTAVKTAKLTRTADVDEVTGDVKYSDWTTGYWSDYTAPVVPGYTANYPYIAGQAVTGKTEDQTLEITYTANDQATHVNYVDAQGKTIHATVVNGKTGQTVKVSSEIPDGWKLVDGQSVPSEITFGPTGHVDTSVKIEHQHVTVTPDKPQANGTELPDNPKQSFHGVEASDLNKTVTRMIKVTTPTGKTDTIQQEVKLTRIATVDEVTGDVNYGDWSIGQWDAYQVPSLNGYTATQPEVAATSVNENTTNQTVDVSYTPNKQSTVVKYVDDDNQVVHTTPVNGVTDQTVKVPNEVPAGWMITNGNVPSEITFGADGHEAIEVTVEHQHVTVDPTDPKNPTDTLPDNPAKNYPAGVSESDLNKTITRTIKITQPDGTATNKVQTVKLTRTADVDEVTGEVTYGKWTTGQWDAYEIPSTKGYTASQASVAAMSVTSDTKDQTVEVSYTANKQSTVVKYVDDKGQVVYTTTVNGVTDQTVKVPSEVPAGWMITKGKVPNEITFSADGHEPIEVTVSHRHVTVDPDHPQTNGTKLPNNPAKTFNGVDATDLNKTTTRAIKVTTPDGQTKTVTQTVKLTRTADVDEVTGEVIYGNWTTGQWDAYEVPTVPGYTASQTSVAATPVDGITKDQTITISYTANSQTTHINYVDESGKTVHTTTVTGKTGETVKVPNEVPTGWMITKGQVPSEISFGPNGHTDETITISHRHVTVDSDHPQTNGTKLPDNPAKTFNGVEENDLNKTITRTIKVTIPDGKTTTIKQTTKLTRTATVDEVTGYVIYSNWSTGQWTKYDVPAVNGYTSTQTEVAAVSVNDHTTDQTVDVSYTPNKQTTTVKYVDDKGEVVYATTVDGVTNQTVKVPSEVPVGWTIVKGQVPSELTFGANGHESIEVTVAHHHVTVTPDHPQTNGTKLPDNPAKTFNGVEENDLNKTITRTIKVTTPDGKTATTTQIAKLTRTVSVDEVTGEVAYGDWPTGEWAAYDVPSVAGYTPSQVKVDKETVTAAFKDTTTTITYTPNQHQISVEYVDDDAYGKVVKTDQVPGKTDQTITITPSAPTNYDLVDNGNRTYTVTRVDGQRVQIHVTHHQVTTSESKTVARTINVHTPHDGVKTVTQTVDLSRDVTTDQVTGEKTYGDWTTGQWKAYTPEAIPGYIPSTSEVPSANVDGSSTDQTVDVTYAANAQHVDIVYVDDAKGGAVVKTDQVVGKTDETVNVTPNVPTGYKVVGEVPGSYTMTADGHQAITVHLVHQMKTASESKAVTRTINVNMPHDGTTVFKQTVDLSRDVTTDQVTGDKTYGEWSTTEWTHYNVPAVAGYTPSIKQVAQQVVDGTTKDQTVNVTYTANAQTTHVNYVDGNGNVVHITTVTGKTDQTVKVPNETPAGWTIIAGQVPSEVTFGADGNPDVKIPVDHKTVTVAPDDPKTDGTKLPDNPLLTFHGVDHDDLNKTVTRTIKVTTPDRQTKTVTQTARLTRAADVDEVTGKVTYGKWTIGEWSRYEVPSVPGYTASQNEVPAVNVTDATKDQMLTLTYTANDQTTHVNYVDGNGKTVHTTTITGKTDQTVKVPNEVPTGWTITDGQVPAEITFGPDGHDDVTVTVGHQHLTVTPDQPKTPSDKLPNNPGKTYPSGVGHDDLNKTVTRTIKVTTPDGKTQTTVQKVQLTCIANVDEVTGEVTYGKWTTGEWSIYEVPAVPGYIASQSDVPATKVTSDTKNQTVTVTYMANAQITTINYVDQTGKTVHTTVVNGHTDQTVNVPNETPVGWTTTKGQVPTEITFGSNGHDYVTVTVDHKHVSVTPDKPQTDGTKLPDNPSQTFHGVGRDDLNKTITRTIEVTAPTGKTDTIKQTAKLTRTAMVDEVTGEVVYGDWTTSEWPAFIVPSVAGYTPSQKTLNSITVKPGDKDIDQTVVYVPDVQSIVVNYIDDITGEPLKTDTLTGKSELASDYITKNNINGYENQHYVLVSDETQGKTLTFDHDDKATQVYNVHLSHQTESVSQSRTVHEMINYVYADGSKAADTVTEKPLIFTQIGVKDIVNGNIDWNGTWTADQVFAEVESPEIIGYTASRKVVDPITVDHNSSDIHQTVIYIANNQTAKVKYIDDTTGKTLETDSVNGKFGDQIDFGHDVDTQIKAFEGQGYKFKSNSFNGQKYQADNSQNEFEVHFTHGNQDVSRTDKVTETVKYQFADGRQAQKDHVQTAEFTQHGVRDLVTKTTVWTPSDPQTFVSVDTPHIIGYTADVQNVPAVTVDFGDVDITKVVTYKVNDQLAGIKYIDDTTGKALDTEAASGKFGTKIEFMSNPSSMIQKFEGKGYKLVSNSFKDQDYQSDNSKNQFEVHFTHGTQNVSRTNKVTETVKYQFADGRQAQKDHVQTVEFTQHGVQDLVTKTTDWAPSDPQTFVSVDSPKIIGYTADIQKVPAVTVKFGDADITKVVTYKANDQLAGIKYIDDTTGKTLDTEAASGKFGTKIEFMSDPLLMIQKFEGQGYKFKSNSFKDQAYQADNSKNHFEVHFKHGMKDVSRTSTITRTINYVDQNTGKEVRQPVIQTLTFTENGVTDLVTGDTTWNTPSDQQFAKVESPKIDGYENPDILVVDAKTAKFGDDDQTVTVHYQKVETPSTTDTPKEPNNSSTPNVSSTQNESNSSVMPQASSQTASGQQINNNRDENQLPQTGNQDSHQVGLIGLMSLTMAGLLGFGKRRKKND